MNSKQTYKRIRHAAHTGRGTGWDLEQIDIAADDPQTPEGYEYVYGYVDRLTGEQHCVFSRRAELSPGKCRHCR